MFEMFECLHFLYYNIKGFSNIQTFHAFKHSNIQTLKTLNFSALFKPTPHVVYSASRVNHGGGWNLRGDGLLSVGAVQGGDGSRRTGQ